MSFAFHPVPEIASSQEAGRGSITPNQGTQESCIQEQSRLSDMHGFKSPELWHEAPFEMPTSTYNLWKRDAQGFLPHPAFDLPTPGQLSRYKDFDNSGARCNPRDLTAWYKENEQVRQQQDCKDDVWSQRFRPSETAFQAYSKAPTHQRHESISSDTYSCDERYVPASDPGSDLSSDYSDLFQTSGLPFPPHYPAEAREAMLPSSNVTDTQRQPLPSFVMEELKRLKLENMALRHMAQEVVRISVGPGPLYGHSAERPVSTCTQHPPLASPPRLQRVFEGADPMQVYREERYPSTEERPAARGQGTAASMWAPARQKAGPISSGERSSPANVENKPFRASDISAEELRRRVATVGMDPSPPLPSQQQHITASDSPLGATPPAGYLPAHLRSSSFANSPPRNSPGPTAQAPAKLENAPASTLVGMILEKRGQEASLLLQQQLKSGNPERQEEIIQAICARMVPLSHDRHGNFLVQGAIELRPETAMHLKGAFVELTMSQFGCHVVQKALEGEEDVREAVTEELLGSQLDQTLTSRHSIHVWQRILETEWKRPHFREHIFTSVNRQLKGRWARTARQETGSIICQNIFESAEPKEKAECMQEVLEELDECAMNQWGVWVVQHIIEHGAEEERRAALRGVVRSAPKLTLSQFGQKAVMSGLKTGDRHFLQDYVDVMCQSSQPRRPPLIDVCLAPHGIQIVTQLLTTVDQKTRERIISTVRRNSVFLKGSKAGMKVHQLCERARAFAGY